MGGKWTAARAWSLAAEAARFFAAACGGLAVDWAAWFLLWRAGLAPMPAQAASRAIGAIFVYFVLDRLVYGGGDNVGGRRGRFVAAAAGSWCLSVAAVGALSIVLPGPLAKGVSDGISFAVNFVVMRLWVFRRAKAAPGT